MLGCSSNAKTQPVIRDTSVAVSVSEPTPVAAAETDRIYHASAHWFDSALGRMGFNGGMIVAKNGNIVFEKYHGTAHLPGKDSINENTPMQIASTSKTFTAMAVLKLWQDGKLNIDDLFSKYFPQFNYPGVTIRTMLNHRSGLPNYLYFMDELGWDKTKFVHNQDVLDYLVNYKSRLNNINPPNKHFEYCNTNFALLALLIEKTSGQRFPDFMRDSIFTPLQMKSTFIFNPETYPNAAPSYDWRGRLEPYNYLDEVYGDKNVYTTPRDLLKWDRALTCGNIFTPATLEQAYTPYSNEKRGVKNYGLGWRMNIYPNGKKMIYHNGWWHGSNSAFIRLIQDSATIIIIGNKYNTNVYKAKMLAPVFGNYLSSDEDDEAENSRMPVTTTPIRRRHIIHHAVTKKHRRKR